jgi:polyisoprenoid-binding protein YceI
MTRQWTFDMQHSSISFKVRHLLVAKVRGRFTRWRGALHFDERHPSDSSVDVEIDAGSIDTAEPARDAHLRSADFFDVANFPHMTFRSRRVEAAGEGFRVAGELTLRGVTRPVVLEVEYGGSMRDPYGNDRAGFSARATIDRKAFGINFNQVLDHGGLALGELVTIEIEVAAVRAVAQAARAAQG